MLLRGALGLLNFALILGIAENNAPNFLVAQLLEDFRGDPPLPLQNDLAGIPIHQVPGDYFTQEQLADLLVLLLIDNAKAVLVFPLDP